MLKTLLEGPANLNQLNLEQCAFEKKSSEVFKMYQDLKDSRLYDAELGQWNGWVDQQSGGVNDLRYTRTQLLALLLETKFSPLTWSEDFERLKTTDLYNREDDNWYCSITQSQDVRDRTQLVEFVMLAILLETKRDLQHAKEMFDKLKQDGYDPEQCVWHSGFTEDYFLHSSAQLIGLLLQAEFNQEKVLEDFQRLKSSKTFNQGKGLWHNTFHLNELENPSECDTYTQLLAALAEAKLGLPTAESTYADLKASGFYSKRFEMWKETKDSFDRLCPREQLLGLLIENEFAESAKSELGEQIPALPRTKDWQ